MNSIKFSEKPCFDKLLCSKYFSNFFFIYIFILCCSLFAPQFFENITCPVGPHDKSKSSTLDLPDLYENIELPVSTNQEDPYGGENCKCNCHDATDSKLKSGNEHCASCGTRVSKNSHFFKLENYFLPVMISILNSRVAIKFSLIFLIK